LIPKLRLSMRKLLAGRQLPSVVRILTMDVTDPAQNSALPVKAKNLSTYTLHRVPIHKDLGRAPSVMEEKSFTLAENLLSGLRMCRGQEKRLNFSGWTCKPSPNGLWVL